MSSHRLQATPQPQRAPRRKTGLLVVGALGAVLAGVTACSAVAAQSEPVAATSAIPAAAAAPAQQQGQTLSGPNLATNDTSIGKVATSDGFTVYQFRKDTKSPSKSNCTGACEQQWPPVLASDTPWLKGVPSDKVGEVTRDDGSKQLTLGGWPVYRFAKDTAPGDTKGNGVGGTWCAIGPDGKPLMGSWAGGSGAAQAPAAAPETQAPETQAPAADSGYGSGGSSAGGYSSGGY